MNISFERGCHEGRFQASSATVEEIELESDHGFLVSAPFWQKTVTGNRGLSSPIPRLLPAQENPPTLLPCPDALAFFPPRITFGEKWRNGDRPWFTAQDSLARSIAKNRKPWSVPNSLKPTTITRYHKVKSLSWKDTGITGLSTTRSCRSCQSTASARLREVAGLTLIRSVCHRDDIGFNWQFFATVARSPGVPSRRLSRAASLQIETPRS